MIPLIRGAETTVLEDAGQLNAYQAQGWERVTWDEYRTVQRTATDAIMARLIAAAHARPAGSPSRASGQNTCRYCHMGPIVRPLGYTPWCRACKRPQVDDAKQR